VTGAFFAAALGLLAWLIWSASRPGVGLGRTKVALGVLIAPVVVVTAIGGAALGDRFGGPGHEPRFGEIRLTLKSLDLPSGAGILSVGGGTEDGLVVEQAPEGLLTLSPVSRDADARARDPVADLSVRAPQQADSSVSVVSVGQDFVGSEPFPPGSSICLSDCTGSGIWYHFEAQRTNKTAAAGGNAGDLLSSRTHFVAKTAAGDTIAGGNSVGTVLPRREVVAGVPAPRPWRPSQAVYPVARYLDGVDAEADRLRSVLFQQGGLLGTDWKILVLDPGVSIALPGQGPRRVRWAVATEDRPAGWSRTVAPGVRVAVWDVRYRDAARHDEPAGRLQERRALNLVREGEGLSIHLETPATEIVATCAKDGALKVSDIRYPMLGGALAASLDQRPVLPRDNTCTRFTSGDFRPDGGLVTPVFEMERFAPPWSLVLLVLVWSITVLRVQGDHWRDRAGHWALFCCLQVLLGLRFLIAISGAAADPELIRPEALIGNAAIAFVVVPILFLLLSPPDQDRLVWAASLGLFAATALVAGGLYQRAVPDGLVLICGVLAILGAAGIAVFHDRFTEASQPASARRTWPLLLGVSAVARAVLGFFSIKERIPGLGFAVSVLYTPAIILGFSGLLAEALTAPAKHHLRLGFWFIGGLFLMLVILPILVKDNGYVIVAIPVAAMAAWGAWKTAEKPALPVRLFWSAPAAGLAAILLGIFVAGASPSGFADRQEERIAAAMIDPTDVPALTILKEAVDEKPNMLRIWMLMDPERLLHSGASAAEDLRVISLHLSEYTGSFFGRGYLSPVNLSVLKTVQLNDNVSAVHLMSPFGRISAAALLVLLAILPAALARMTRREGVPRDRWEIAGFMALWVIFGVDAYMVLANLQLVPFTGRNVYLLAAASDSDLLEGAGLMVLAWLGVSGVLRRGVAGLETIAARILPAKAV